MNLSSSSLASSAFDFPFFGLLDGETSSLFTDGRFREGFLSDLLLLH